MNAPLTNAELTRADRYSRALAEQQAEAPTPMKLRDVRGDHVVYRLNPGGGSRKFYFASDDWSEAYAFLLKHERAIGPLFIGLNPIERAAIARATGDGQ